MGIAVDRAQTRSVLEWKHVSRFLAKRNKRTLTWLRLKPKNPCILVQYLSLAPREFAKVTNPFSVQCNQTTPYILYEYITPPPPAPPTNALFHPHATSNRYCSWKKKPAVRAHCVSLSSPNHSITPEYSSPALPSPAQPSVHFFAHVFTKETIIRHLRYLPTST